MPKSQKLKKISLIFLTQSLMWTGLLPQTCSYAIWNMWPPSFPRQGIRNAEGTSCLNCLILLTVHWPELATWPQTNCTDSWEMLGDTKKKLGETRKTQWLTHANNLIWITIHIFCRVTSFCILTYIFLDTHIDHLTIVL